MRLGIAEKNKTGTKSLQDEDLRVKQRTGEYNQETFFRARFKSIYCVKDVKRLCYQDYLPRQKNIFRMPPDNHYTAMKENKTLLILAQGNDMRGDDALGPLLVQRLNEEFHLNAFDFEWEFQLSPEHATRFDDYACIILADASIGIKQPFELSRVVGIQTNGLSSHALSPAELLYIYQTHLARSGKIAPVIYQLQIKAEQFELGAILSDEANNSLEKTWHHVRDAIILCNSVNTAFSCG